MPTYLGALFFGLPVWVILFLLRKDLRHKMILMSLLVAFVAPIDTFFIPNYWHPLTMGNLFGLPIDTFTLLFGFTLGGIASVLYEELLRKTYIRSRKPHKLKFLVILGPLTIFSLLLFTNLNFMIDIIVGTILTVFLILSIRHDLFTDAILSGIFFAILYSVMLSFYIALSPEILQAWNFAKFPQTLIINLPHYEILWAFWTGAFLGILYEFSHDKILKTLPHKS